jgi:hypothetical protein
MSDHEGRIILHMDDEPMPRMALVASVPPLVGVEAREISVMEFICAGGWIDTERLPLIPLE